MQALEGHLLRRDPVEPGGLCKQMAGAGGRGSRRDEGDTGLKDGKNTRYSANIYALKVNNAIFLLEAMRSACTT